MITHCYSGINLLRCGSQDGFIQNGEGLVMEREDSVGIFISRIYDSGREGIQWNRISVDINSDAIAEIYVWIFDKTEACREELLQEDVRKWFAEQKKYAGYHSHYREMLLYGHGCGRYARLAVEVLPGDGEKAVFRGYDLSFPKESFTEYLPAIYQNNLQLERFLAVQQYIYLETEKNADCLAEKLDYELCGRKRLVRLAGWLGWGELAWQVDRDTLIKLIRFGITLSGKKGTCAYYVELTEILTGQKAVMTEEPEKCRAVVLVLGQPEGGREKHLEWLRKNVPIGIRIDFIILHGTDRLDGQYFLDNTSYLSRYESEITEYGCSIECLRLQ